MNLTEYAKKQNEAAEFARAVDVREYREKMGDYPKRLRSALAELEKLAPSLEKFLAEKTREYPQSPNYPPALKAQVAQLHGDYLNPCRQRLSSAGTAAKIRARLDKIENAKPENFIHYSPETLAPLDAGQAEGVLNEVNWLRDLPGKVAAVEAVISETLQYWREREQAGAGYKPEQAALVSCQPESGEGKQEDQFDARLS